MIQNQQAATGQVNNHASVNQDLPTHTGPWPGLFAIMLLVAWAAFSLLFFKPVKPTGGDATNPVIFSRAEDRQRFSEANGYLPADDTLGFVEIPAGAFTMGSDPAFDRSAYANERWSQGSRQGQVNLSTFFIGRYEVTIAQYRRFLEDSGYGGGETNMNLQRDGALPVTAITWVDALAYCRWLQTQLQNNPSTPEKVQQLLKSGWRITLPSEAQWEKAARGTDGRIYPWGNRLESTFANFQSAGLRPVGSTNCLPCSFGLADMSGNAWELTGSPFKEYPFDPEATLNPAGDALYIMRGGSFREGGNNIRAAVRGGIDPGARNDAIGFRLVLTR